MPWASRQTAIINLLGYSTNVNGPLGAGNYVKRQVPHACVDWSTTGSNFIYCDKIDCKGIGMPVNLAPGQITTTSPSPNPDGATEQIPLYNLARLGAHYTTFLYDFLSDAQMLANGYVDTKGKPDESFFVRYVTREVHSQGEFFSVPANGASGSGMKFVGVAQQVSLVKQGISKLIVPYNIALTWHAVPQSAVPCWIINNTLSAPGAFDVAVGRVNNDLFDNYPVGTLLLMGGEFKPKRSLLGERLYDITYLIKYFQPGVGFGHNFLYYPIPPNPGWVEVTADGNTNIPGSSNPLDPFGLGFLLPGVFGHNATDGFSIYDWAPFKPLFRSP